MPGVESLAAASADAIAKLEGHRDRTAQAKFANFFANSRFLQTDRFSNHLKVLR
jgi:hypothetical protein